MKPRVSSLHESLFPVQLPEFSSIADLWPTNVINEILSLVWEAFDQMKLKHFERVDFSVDYEQLERGLTALHIREILLLWKSGDGFGAFIPVPEACEWRSRASRSSKPLAVDIGFESYSNPSLHFSVEAKVLESPEDISRYLSDLTDKYLTGRASPVFPEAALAGYLRTGHAEEVFHALEARLAQTLQLNGAFPLRAHRISHHIRILAGERENSGFVCQHLIFELA